MAVASDTETSLSRKLKYVAIDAFIPERILSIGFGNSCYTTCNKGLCLPSQVQDALYFTSKLRHFRKGFSSSVFTSVEVALQVA